MRMQFRYVHGVTPKTIVRRRAVGLPAQLIAAARGLVAHGIESAIASRKFLLLFLEVLKQAAGVLMPVSALMRTPIAGAALPIDRHAGIPAMSAGHPARDRLAAAGALFNTPVAGTDGCGEFNKKIPGDLPEIRSVKCLHEVRRAAFDLLSGNGRADAIVPGRSNMVPFAAGFRKLTGRPVCSIHAHACRLEAEPAPRQFRFSLADRAPQNKRQRRV